MEEDGFAQQHCSPCQHRAHSHCFPPAAWVSLPVPCAPQSSGRAEGAPCFSSQPISQLPSPPPSLPPNSSVRSTQSSPTAVGTSSRQAASSWADQNGQPTAAAYHQLICRRPRCCRETAPKPRAGLPLWCLGAASGFPSNFLLLDDSRPLPCRRGRLPISQLEKKLFFTRSSSPEGTADGCYSNDQYVFNADYSRKAP